MTRAFDFRHKRNFYNRLARLRKFVRSPWAGGVVLILFTVLALVLAIVMVCSLLPVSAFAAEPDYELRVLTFEDADYKGGTNFAGGNNWTSLIDSPQYGGKLLYGESGAGVDSVDAAYKWTDKNNTWLSNTLSEGYGSAAATTARITSPCITVMPIIPAMA